METTPHWTQTYQFHFDRDMQWHQDTHPRVICRNANAMRCWHAAMHIYALGKHVHLQTLVLWPDKRQQTCDAQSTFPWKNVDKPFIVFTLCRSPTVSAGPLSVYFQRVFTYRPTALTYTHEVWCTMLAIVNKCEQITWVQYMDNLGNGFFVASLEHRCFFPLNCTMVLCGYVSFFRCEAQWPAHHSVLSLKQTGFDIRVTDNASTGLPNRTRPSLIKYSKLGKADKIELRTN